MPGHPVYFCPLSLSLSLPEEDCARALAENIIWEDFVVKLPGHAADRLEDGVTTLAGAHLKVDAHITRVVQFLSDRDIFMILVPFTLITPIPDPPLFDLFASFSLVPSSATIFSLSPIP